MGTTVRQVSYGLQDSKQAMTSQQLPLIFFQRYVSYNNLFGTYEVPVPGYNYTILQAAPQPDTSNGLIQRFGIHITEGLRAMLAYNYILFRIPDNPVARKYKTGCQVCNTTTIFHKEYKTK